MYDKIVNLEPGYFVNVEVKKVHFVSAKKNCLLLSYKLLQWENIENFQIIFDEK